MVKNIAVFMFIIALAACDNGASPSQSSSGDGQEEEKKEEQEEGKKGEEQPPKEEDTETEEPEIPRFSGFILSGEPVTGVLYEEMEVQDFTATLPDGYSFSYMKNGFSADGWILNLPVGLTAKLKKRVSAGDTSLVITVSGKPYEERAETLILEIPEAYIVAPESGKEAPETAETPETPEEEKGVMFAIAPSPDSTEGIAIGTAEDLAKIGNDDAYPLDGGYYLTADIDLGTYDPWPPIGRRHAAAGEAANPFTGTLNGNGKTIRNLKLSESGFGTTAKQANGRVTGLFGCTEAALIKNLTVDIGNYTMTAPGGSHYIMHLSPLAAYASWTRFYGITVKGTLNIDFDAQYGDNELRIGAIGGYIGGGEVAGCVSTLEINGTGKGSYTVGGIAGYDVTTKYINNRAEGDITINVVHSATWAESLDIISLYIGGFIGNGAGKGELSRNTVTGNISISASGTADEVYNNEVLVQVTAGGFAGRARGKIKDCTASGNLTVEIAGQSPRFGNAIGTFGDGFAGYGDDTYITNCAYTGTITETHTRGEGD
jgi:hypothetical protein